MAGLIKKGLLTGKRCVNEIHRRYFYSKVTGVPRDFLAKIQTKIDLSPEAIQEWVKRREFQDILKDHTFNRERLKVLGPDLATAHFVVQRGGAVKFLGSDRWVKKTENGQVLLPSTYVSNLFLEAVDVSDTMMLYDSFDNFVNLNHFKYLNVSKCEYIDDYCLDSFTRFRDTLMMLDISECPNITVGGITSLHKLRNLRRLRLYNMPKVKDKELLALMLEEVLPNCMIECEVDYADPEALRQANNTPVPTFGISEEELQHLPGVMMDYQKESDSQNQTTSR